MTQLGYPFVGLGQQFTLNTLLSEAYETTKNTFLSQSDRTTRFAVFGLVCPYPKSR
jgi:hypothetical protein